MYDDLLLNKLLRFQEDEVCTNTLKTNATRVFDKLLKHIAPQPRYQDPGFAHIGP